MKLSNTTTDQTQQPEITVKPRLRRAGDYAKLLAAASKSPTNAVERAVDGLSHERVAAAIDAVGRLQESYIQMGERLDVMHRNLAPYLNEEGSIKGAAYVAKTDVLANKKLLSPQKITTLLLYLLSEVEESHTDNGGLFDMILSLDNEVLNEHFVPILDAVFQKAGLSDKAAKLYAQDTKKQVKVVPIRPAA